ncbi:hypothetical protein, partial [uncultured Legionella sp.]|uniref:hypothetical protein n=1 Tax=uncultured Legionella sp. TaxID=210934 RepID=UPI0026048DB9
AGVKKYGLLTSGVRKVSYIVNSYEKVKEQQTEDLKALNLKLENKVQERTNELKRANQQLEQEKLTLKKLSYTDPAHQIV